MNFQTSTGFALKLTLFNVNHWMFQVDHSQQFAKFVLVI